VLSSQDRDHREARVPRSEKDRERERERGGGRDRAVNTAAGGDGSCVGCVWFVGPRERVIGYNFCGPANRIRRRCVCVTGGARVARESGKAAKGRRQGGRGKGGEGGGGGEQGVSPRGNNRCELLTGAAARALRVAPTGEINRPAATAAEKGTDERARLSLYV